MDEAARRLDGYLAGVRACLGRLPEAEVAEVVAELRSHVLDSAGEGGLTDGAVAAVLGRLGSPDELASQYIAQGLLARAEGTRSPWRLLTVLGQVGRTSLTGLLGLLGLVFGYGLSLAFALAALRKPLAPASVGLWQLGPDSFSLRLGFGGTPAGHELLGWWIVPVGLLLGGTGLWVTTAFGRSCIRRLRRSPLGAA